MPKDTCTPVLAAVLFTIARTWKQPKCPSKDEWIKKMDYIYIYIYIHTLLLLLSRFSRVRLCATHRRQPTRLPRPWDSPGKNTGVGCHFLLQCMKVKSEREVAQSCPTLSDPMDYSLPGDFPGKSTGVGCHCFLRYIHTHTHIYSPRILLSHKKEWNNAICSNMEGPRDYHI